MCRIKLFYILQIVKYPHRVKCALSDIRTIILSSMEIDPFKIFETG